MKKKYDFPSFSQALIIIFLFVIMQELVFSIIFVFQSFFSLNASDAAMIIPTNIIVFGGVLFLCLKITGAPFHEMFPLKPASISLLAAMIPFLLGLVILLSELDNLFRMIHPVPDIFQQAIEDILETENTAAGFFLLAILAPVTEEPLFRGAFLRGFTLRYSRRKAIVLQAFLFMLLHVNPWVFASSFTAGLVFGYIFTVTRSLIPVIFGHMTINGAIFLVYNVLHIDIPGFTSADYQKAVFQPWWFDLLGLALIVSGSILLINSLNSVKNRYRDNFDEKVKNAPPG